MNNESRAAYSGIGFSGLLGIVFIVLKLTGVINWSWWWVLAPLWGQFLLGLVLLGGIVLFTTKTSDLQSRFPSKRSRAQK